MTLSPSAPRTARNWSRARVGDATHDVHDLVGLPRLGMRPDEVGGGGARRRGRDRRPVSPDEAPRAAGQVARHRRPGERLVQGAIREVEASATGVDHPGGRQHRQPARGVGQRLPGRGVQRPRHLGERAALRRGGERAVGRGVGHGEDRALDRGRHGRPRALPRQVHSPREARAVQAEAVDLGVFAGHLGHAAQQLAEDHPGVAPRGEQGTPSPAPSARRTAGSRSSRVR
jgi:hypothetical protein